MISSMEKKYLVGIIILLVVTIGGGAFYIYSRKNGIESSSPLPTQKVFATIEATPEIEASNSGNIITMQDGLKIQDERVGSGTEAVSGKTITVNYIGTLNDGTKFDSSYDRGQPFSFTLGAGEVIRGWDEGVVGMKVGGKRKLIIPPDLGYGQNGVPGIIPGGSTLIFEVELLKVE